ncbi:serine hydrolase domain-containing protein [Streptomyces sp. H10-C2]|uniref:serine hydrolase domain-containing protein n=1 Tax=unclassified Streptomyces TaxID=2593676 RepID=UPI0024BA1B16|nr:MULTISPECIES: serine hydrolase domain-containing protein [unclassified Streptomyces]MDJ0344442.1 serine hydrolase domain-containing protein [Streptomyces sp. PH10-H1]MDJ0372082.1 serine hydrolase domain-containing protein [Streptomyces sp. H10-C2]
MLALSTLAPLSLTASPAQAAPPTAAVATADPDVKDCPPHGLDPALVARLDEAIERARKETGVPGVTVGLWLPGRGSYVRSSGVANTVTHAPMTPGLNMRIGSETKTFTATAVLELVDDGLVKLDDPISAYIDGVPDGNHITIRQLAEMRSGLFSYSADPDFVQALLSDPTRPFTPQELLAYAFRHPNVFAPGAKFQYSNTNYILLGLVVEKLGKMPLADFIHQRVTGPAHLHHTLFPQGAEFPEPHAHGYTNQTLTGAIADTTHWNPSWGWAAGAMISDLHDLHHWAKVVATGTLLSPATQKQREKFIPVPGFDGAGYGLGLFQTHGWIGHNGSLPGYESVTMYLPKQDATMVVLLNTDILHNGFEPSTLFARAITSIATPDHVYDLPAGG